LAQAGEYQLAEDLRGYFPDFRHFIHGFSPCDFRLIKKPEAVKERLPVSFSLPYARITEFRFKGSAPILSGLSAFQLP
jgi:hypothetical protein